MRFTRFNISCVALVFLSFFHLSLSEVNSNGNKNYTLTKLIGDEERACNSTTGTSPEAKKGACKDASKELDSKNYTNCCFIKASYNVEPSDTSSDSNSSSGRLLTENTVTDYKCVRLFKGSVYIQKEKEKYKAYDKVEIECFSSSTILKQGLIIGIALMLLI